MKNIWSVTIVLAFLAFNAQAEEVAVNSRYVSLGLFKNGLTVVKKSVSLPGPGTYRLADVPEPVHGTFWIESDSVVEARMTSQAVDVPIRWRPGSDYYTELVGHEVAIHFRDRGIPSAVGKIVAVERPGNESAPISNRQNTGNSAYSPAIQPPSSARFLVLDSPEGRTYIDASMIAYLHTEKWNRTMKQRKPVMLITVPEMEKKPAEVFISYLTRGLSWAPGYRVDISSPDILTLRQNAVLKNEMSDIEDAEIFLISGFPSIQFAHVISPFSLRTSWTQFFQQLNQRIGSGYNSGLNAATQQVITMNTPAVISSLDLSATPSGDGVDLHYLSIGRRNLDSGDSLAVETASGKAPYKRIVEWIIPDTRKVNGRYIDDYQRQQDPEKYEDSAWDAVCFRNPLPFPMTTAPAMIVSDGRFNGQRLTYWVNSGEETTLHITKALSLRTYHVEHEEPDSREIVYVGGNDFRKIAVKGELKVNNHRKEAVSLVIRRRFSGELIEAEGAPQCVLREEGVYSINKRNELVWTLDLKPGEERALAYRYSVLVDH